MSKSDMGVPYIFPLTADGTFALALSRGEKPPQPVCASCHKPFDPKDNKAPAYAELKLEKLIVYLPVCKTCLDGMELGY